MPTAFRMFPTEEGRALQKIQIDPIAEDTQKDVSLKPPFSLKLLRSESRVETREAREHSLNSEDGDDGSLPIPLVSASYRTTKDDISIASADDVDYLRSELAVARLNSIHQWLWIVGRPMPPRALHLQRIKSRELYITEQMDLHLVWSSKRIYLKPIPRFLFDLDFWQKYLCPNRPLYECAMGFLLSYTALISHQSDYRIAREAHLIPGEITWSKWVLLVEQLLCFPHPTHVNKRYIYGELRLGRLNLVYRLRKGRIRGYLSSCTTYADFFRENLTSFLTLFAYVSIVLSAMQVGLATQQLSRSGAFNATSYGFVVFAIVAPLVAVATVVVLLVALSAYNLIVTLAYRRQRLSGLGRS